MSTGPPLPLHIAATDGHDRIVSDLVLKWADKNARDIRGHTPLMLTAQHGHLCAANTLLVAGASFNLRRSRRPVHPALDWAAEKGHVRVLQTFLDHGADANTRDADGGTALHVTASSDHAGAVHALIDAGADIESRTAPEESPFPRRLLERAQCVGRLVAAWDKRERRRSRQNEAIALCLLGVEARRAGDSSRPPVAAGSRLSSHRRRWPDHTGQARYYVW